MPFRLHGAGAETGSGLLQILRPEMRPSVELDVNPLPARTSVAEQYADRFAGRVHQGAESQEENDRASTAGDDTADIGAPAAELDERASREGGRVDYPARPGPAVVRSAARPPH